MEGERRLSSRVKRKPLSDCTNLHPSKLISQTLTKPPLKPSNFPNSKPSNLANISKRKENPNCNFDVNGGSNSSLKSHTSTGSNNSPVSDCIISQPPTPIKLAVDRDYRKTGLSAAQIHWQDERSKKDRGKSVAVTTVKASDMLATRAAQISSSAASGNGGCVSRLPPIKSNKVEEQKRKGKGKSVPVASVVNASAMLATQAVQLSSSAAFGNDGCVSRPLPVFNNKVDEQKRKDKGKMVLEAPVICTSAPLISQPPHISSAAGSGDGACVDTLPPVDNNEVDEQRRKEKGKMVVETPIIHISAPLISHPPQASSSSASGNFYLPRPVAAHGHKLEVQNMKDKDKMIQETPYAEASDPMTPSSLIMSSSAASGTNDQEKPSLVVYAQRRTSRRKKHAVGSVSMPLSCPPDKGTKKKGLQLDGSGDAQSGSHTDPLPLHKRKRSRNKSDASVHAMPDDEVAKLKAYYADIDAFELPEEVASDSE